MVEQPPAQPETPSPPHVEAGSRAGLDRWRYGRILLTVSGALALLAFYAPWERATYFDSGAPGNQQVRDMAFTTIFTSASRVGYVYYGAYTSGGLASAMTHILINTIPPLLGFLLSLALWLRVGHRLRFAILTASGLVLLSAVVVAVEYLRLILAVQSGDVQTMGSATRIGSLRILMGNLYAQRTTTFAWGYYLLVGALLIWAAGLALAGLALRRQGIQSPREESRPDGSSVDRRGFAGGLFALGVISWTVGAVYLPWVQMGCPVTTTYTPRPLCASTILPGGVIYTTWAHDPTKIANYRQIVSARLISPSILNVANDVVFSSLVPFTFIALVGLGAALYALLMRQRRTWGYWAYLAFVALVTALTFARTKTVFDETKIGTDSIAIGMLVTVAGALLIGVAVALLQWRGGRGSAPREGISSDG